MSNKEKILNLVSKEDTTTLNEVKNRIKNRAVLRESQRIALKTLTRLDELNWSQKDLADKMGVRPQQVSKIVSGKENFTLETLIKLQSVLGVPLFGKYHYEQAIIELIKEWATLTTEPVISNKGAFDYTQQGRTVEFNHTFVARESIINEDYAMCA